MKQFFFDDQRLFDRRGLERRYGMPEPLALYSDPNLAIGYCWAHVVKGPDGLFHLLYCGNMHGQGHVVFAAAVSEDGVHFRPRNTAQEAGIQTPLVPNQLFEYEINGEIAAVVDDPLAPPEQRYKILFCSYAHLDENRVEDYVLVSGDLIHFSRLEESCWNPIGTEPAAGAFYNPVRKCYSILARPDWGQRRVAYTETTDWHHFTEMELCLQCDSCDRPLAEIYGMSAFPYGNLFVAFPLTYFGFQEVLGTKYFTGKMEAQLAYSLNGRYWQRSLRTPFLGRERPARHVLPKVNMVFPMALFEQEERLLLHAVTSEYEHGTPPEKMEPSHTGLEILSLRKDGLIGLFTDENGHEGSLATREMVWQGGEPHFNLQASQATCAVYTHMSDKPDALPGLSVLPGFSHEECLPFNGDSLDWIPQWKGNHTLETEAKGKIVVLELRLHNGAVWSLSGEFCPVMNVEAMRYHAWKKLPERPGF